MRNRIWMATAAGLVLLGLGTSASADETMIGKLAAVDVSAKTLAVQETGTEKSTTFSVDDKTKIREGRKDVALAALQTGHSVKVSYAEEGGVALARRVDVMLPMGEDKSTPMPTRVH